MAARTFWTGYLKLSLVTCPVRMRPARTAEETLRFHTVNRETGNRVESRYVDAETGKPVSKRAQVKGYPIKDDRHVMLEDKELESVALKSTRTINIDRFVPATNVGWIWLDRPHFLQPSDEVGAEAFAVIREAMARTETAALSRLVLYRREHPVALLPQGRGIILWTLRYGDEVRRAEIAPDKADSKMTALLGKVIAARTTKWSADFLKDPVREDLGKLIDRKTAKRRKTGAKVAQKTAPAPSGDNVVSIMDALRRSLAEGRKKG